MFNQYCLGVDVSHWQSKIFWDVLKKAGVAFALVKASQGSYRRDPLLRPHLSGARAVGMATGVFHYFEPNVNVDAQLTNLKYALEGLSYDFIALDVEQYWQSWDEHEAGHITRFIPPEQISINSRKMAERIRDHFKKPMLIYTRASFVRGYAMPMARWLPDWDLWMAHYPYDRKRVALTWNKLKELYAPKISTPYLPPGCENWRFWQFSGDKFALPGTNGVIDLDFFHGDVAALYEWLQKDGVPSVALSLEEQVALLWQAHPQLWKEVKDAAQETVAS